MIAAFLIGFLVGVVVTVVWYLKAEEQAYKAGFENGKWSAENEIY